MATLLDENTQYTTTGGVPVVAGSLYIGTKGLDPVLNPITIYSDRELTTPISNPQTLDAYGRSTNKIWVPGKYSLKVLDSNDAQVYIDLDAGETSSSGITTLTNVQGTDTLTAEAVPAVTSYVGGEIYIFTAANTNTAGVTLSFGGGAKALRKYTGQDLEAGDIQQNQDVIVVYNTSGDVFDLITPSTPTINIVMYTTSSATVSDPTGRQTTNGEYDPALVTGLKLARVTVVSGGGAGGGRISTTSSQASTSGGGQAGGTGVKLIAAADITSPEVVTVGAGGAKANPGKGTDGGASSFGAHVTVTGGSAGDSVAASATVRVAGGGDSGGVSTGGDTNRAGERGGVGISLGTTATGGSAAAAIGGHGGSSTLGTGGKATSSYNGISDAGEDGGGYGGGGSGSCNGQSQSSGEGSDGADGVVMVEELF